MRTRTIAFLASLALATLALADAPASAPATAPAGWRAYAIGTVDGLQIGMLVKQDASFADDEFLVLTLDNTTGKPLTLGMSNSYDIRYEATDAAGKLVRSGSLASGNSYDLLRDLADRRPIYPELLPGLSRNADHPSAYSAALLGPTAVPLHVKATVHVTAEIKGGKPADFNCPIEFNWNPLDKQGIAAAQKRLQYIIAHPDTQVQHCYLAGTLLSIPEVAAAVPVKDLLAALDRHREPFSARTSIVKYLDTNHAKDPDVHAYFLKGLAVPDCDALEDVAFRSSNLWDDRYVPLLVKSLDTAGSDFQKNYQPLTLLDAHPETWADDAKIRDTLCQHLLKQFPELQGPPEKIRWESPIEFLAITREPKMVPILAPFLSAKKVVRDFKFDSFTPPDSHPTPLRMCDVAYNAIRKCQGRPKESLDLTPVGANAQWSDIRKRTDATVKAELAQRDTAIEKLQAELK